jgi:hypothetical protein
MTSSTLVSLPPPPTSPSPAGASSYLHSLTPVTTPVLAATLRFVHSSRATTPPSEVPAPLFSPRVVPIGRSKAQLWGDLSPSSGGTPARSFAPASFRELLLHLKVAAASPPPLDVEEGWQIVESIRTRRNRLYPTLRHRRQLPDDLKGKCFNCFSSSHRVASCRQSVHCFRCLAAGHCAAVCSGRPVPMRRMEWRPVSCTSAPSTAAGLIGSPSPVVGVCAEEAMLGGGAGTEVGRSRRRGQVRRRCSNVTGGSSPAPTIVEGESKPTSSDYEGRHPEVTSRPQPLLAQSASLEGREDNMRNGLFMTIIGDPVGVAEGNVLAVISQRFEVAIDSMTIHRVFEAEFILGLHDEAIATRVYNGGQPLITPSLRLHVARWTRFFKSTGVVLLHAVDAELMGVPAHAWSLETAALLLDEFCLLDEPVFAVESHQDVFHVRAWCSRPELIPPAMDLTIEEPRGAVEGQQLRCISYPISLSVVLPLSLTAEVPLRLRPVAVDARDIGGGDRIRGVAILCQRHGTVRDPWAAALVPWCIQG